MKTLIFLSIFMMRLFADSSAEDIMDAFQIRNAKTGIPINLNRNSKIFNYQNWFLNDLGIDPKIKRSYQHTDAFLFGYF